MKKSLIVFLAIFCIGLISLSSINTSTVNAVSYYNWVMGSDMETTTNHIEDGGFESNAFESGVLYGNFSVAVGSPSFTSAQVNSGVYSLYIPTTAEVWYNFSENILGADINQFYGNVKLNLGGGDLEITVYYSDESNDVITEPCTTSWVLYDWTSEINEAKYVNRLLIDATSQNLWIDDFFLGIDDSYSQDQYDFDTYPWRTTGLSSYWQQIGYWDSGWFSYIPFFPFDTMPIGGYVDVDMIGHNLVWGRNSNGSGYIGYDESTAQFIQDIDYLDSDSVHYVDLWVYTAYTESVSVQFVVVYSDRTFDIKLVNITEVSSWEHLNFGGSWIDENKYIIQIQISLANYIPAYVNIDDIGLWSSLPSGSSRFTYTVSPSPISQSPIGFDVYQAQTYTFTGYLWDINGELTENGTVTISHDKGITTASLSDGIFSFSIVQRNSASDFTEQFGISVNNGDTVELYELTVNWIYTGGDGVTDDDDEERADNLINWLSMFLVVFLPALLFAGGIYENNQQPDSMHISPIFGLMAGLVLSVGIGIYTNIVPLWIMILMIIAIVVLVVGMFKK